MMISKRWKNARVLSLKQWYMEFLDIAFMELSVAQCNGANEENVNMWLTILDGIKLYIGGLSIIINDNIITIFFFYLKECLEYICCMSGLSLDGEDLCLWLLSMYMALNLQ